MKNITRALVVVGLLGGILCLNDLRSAMKINNHASTNELDQYITTLVNSPRLNDGYYFEDGASDYSVLVPNPDKAILEIIKLGDKAIPILIEHLDDTRLTSTTFHIKSNHIKVPVGHICLDILRGIVEHNPPMFYESNDDGLGYSWGLNDGYYFRPDDYISSDKNNYRIRLIVKIVKNNWKQAYEQNKVKYRYP